MDNSNNIDENVDQQVDVKPQDDEQKGGASQGSQDLHMDMPAFASDNFRMWDMKVKRCPRARPHDWTICPFAHPGEKATRRDPRKFIYSAVACAEWKKTGQCGRGDACCFSHGVFECWLHPTRYRTQMCADGMGCKRRVCFFAHQESELRHPENCFVPPSKAAQAAVATAGTTPGIHHSHSNSSEDMQKQLIKAITGLLGNQQQAMRQQAAGILRSPPQPVSSSINHGGAASNGGMQGGSLPSSRAVHMHMGTTTRTTANSRAINNSNTNNSSAVDVNAALAKALRELATNGGGPSQTATYVDMASALGLSASQMEAVAAGNGPSNLSRHSVDLGSLSRFPTTTGDHSHGHIHTSRDGGYGSSVAAGLAGSSFGVPTFSQSIPSHIGGTTTTNGHGYGSGLPSVYGAHSFGSLSYGSYGAPTAEGGLSSSTGWPAGEGFAAAQHWFENGGGLRGAKTHSKSESQSSLCLNNNSNNGVGSDRAGSTQSKSNPGSNSSSQIFQLPVKEDSEASTSSCAISLTLQRSVSPSCEERDGSTTSLQTEVTLEQSEVNDLLKSARLGRVFSFDNLLAELPRSASQVQLAL